MEITEKTLFQYLMFNLPIPYTEDLILYPVKMKNVLEFNIYKSSITVRKNSTFPVKKIIKMPYLDFLFFCHENTELANEYNIKMLPYYYSFAFKLLQLVFRDQEVLANGLQGGFKVNGHEITSDQFDDIRRIIIIQNGIDFDIDEFLHYDTEEGLKKAQESLSKGDKSTLEDYIDSICVGMHLTEADVMELTIRKFWRYVERIKKRDIYTVFKPIESFGMSQSKESIPYWMTEIESDDQYKNVKTDTQSLQKMIGG